MKTKYNPLVSILIANYNNENYLTKCLSSVLNQKYKKIEVIVVDDYSNDNSLNILKKYKLTLCVGLCGSMTTFSSWMSHLYKLLNQGLYKLFLLNSLSIVLMGVLAIALGHIFAKRLNA